MSDERDLLSILADGALATGPELARRLVPHAGVYRLLPSTNGLVLLQRLPNSQPTRSGARAVLAGEIDHQGGLAEIIQFIHANAWSGHLEIISGQVRKAIYFRRGDIQSAASNIPDDRLGAILYRYGLVSDTAIAETLKRSPGSPNRIGQLLMQDGLITAHELYTSMRRQVEEIFYSVLNFRGGDFYFFKAGEGDGPPSQLLLSTKGLLFEGMRRIDELSLFRQKLPSPDVVLVRRAPPPQVKLTANEERVLGLVDGVQDIAAIARTSQLGDFDATRILHQLLKSGFLQPQPERPIVGVSADETHARILAAFNEMYAKIHAAVSQNGKKDALLRGLESFFSSVAEFTPLFADVVVQSDGSLSVDRVLTNLGMSPAEDKLDYLHRGLNELLFFELFTAGEAVDRREEIQLHQRLSQILKEAPPSAAPAVEPTEEPEEDEELEIIPGAD